MKTDVMVLLVVIMTGLLLLLVVSWKLNTIELFADLKYEEYQCRLWVCLWWWDMLLLCFHLLIYCFMQICCIEPLCASQSSVSNSSSQPVTAGLLFAMASMSKVLIVALRPELRVHYNRPLTGSGNTLPLLAWHFVSVRMSERERSTDAVLLFARDQYACFLQVESRHLL